MNEQGCVIPGSRAKRQASSRTQDGICHQDMKNPRNFAKSVRIAPLLLLLLILAVPARAAVLTKGMTVRILPVGDSITEGKFVNGGYRLPLRLLLLEAGYPIVYVGKEDNGEAQNDTGFSTGLVNANHEGYGSMRVDEILNGGSEEGHERFLSRKPFPPTHPTSCC